MKPLIRAAYRQRKGSLPYRQCKVWPQAQSSVSINTARPAQFEPLILNPWKPRLEAPTSAHLVPAYELPPSSGLRQPCRHNQRCNAPHRPAAAPASLSPSPKPPSKPTQPLLQPHKHWTHMPRPRAASCRLLHRHTRVLPHP